MSTDIMEIVNQNPAAVLVDEKQYSEFYKRVKEECASHVVDVSTNKGRDEIRRLAYKVTRSKTAIDDAGKKLNEEARARINAVDAQRRKIREELDALAAEVRAPLTKWEKDEEDRANKAKEIRDNVIGLGNSSPGETTQDIRDRIDQLAEIILTGEILRDEYEQTVKDRDASLSHLHDHLARAVKAEEDAAELARLRAEADARATAERERLAKEAAEREAKDAAERERIAKEKAEAEYRANVEREAEKARQAEIAKAKAEQERIEREAAAKIAAAEAEAKRVRDEAEKAERERREAAEKMKREEDARAADRRHRSEIMKSAKEAIMAQGCDEEIAKKIVLAIVAGEVPNTRITF